MRAPPGPMSGLFAGRYAIERVLGQGATATVHLARDTQGGTAVALKILRAELAESAASGRFLKEIRRTSGLQHPHILPVLDSGEYEGQLFFALPYMEGGTLRQLLAREKSLEFSRVIEIARPIAEALDYAHQRGLIHRDVKPENILFTSGRACLGDFGIARALEMSGADTTSTSRNTVRGTPAYMSPEQAAGGGDLDGRSDVYSLACVLYEMITGMQAFIGPTPEQVISQRFAHPPREVRVYRPAAPASIDFVLAKAFAMTPADRYRTADELVDALEKAIEAPSEVPVFRSRTSGDAPARRFRAGRTLIAIGGVVAVAASSWGFLEWKDRKEIGRAIVNADTTAIMVFPVEGDTTLPLARVYDLLYTALSRWKGISLAHTNTPPVLATSAVSFGSWDEPRVIAALARAGRYIRVRALRSDDELRAVVALYNVESNERLYEVPVRARLTLADGDSVFRAAADSLLLRGIDATLAGSNLLPAVQSFARAMQFVHDWDLRLADSVLTETVERDPQFARASLWLAEVRAARSGILSSGEMLASAWRPAAERALAIGGLSKSETHLANALVALGSQRFEDACRHFDWMRRADERDFTAWYGLGQCRQMDSLVVRDPRSPSGWRFRSSRHRAIQAFAKAFMLRPTLHRSVQAGEYRTMRNLLFTNAAIVREGYSAAPDNTHFFAYPEWQADTLAFVPYRTSVVGAGRARFDREAVAAALRKQRTLFIEITRSWASALPRSPGTKEALAISLEMVGDRAAVDTIRAARALTNDPFYQLQLAALEVLMRVEFARLSDSSDIRSARILADSLLAANRSPSATRAQVLAPIAALLGRCQHAARLEAHARSSGYRSSVRVGFDSLDVLMAAGCAVRFPEEFVARGIRAVAADPALQRISGKTDADIEMFFVGRALSFAFPLDSARVVRLAKASSDYVLRAESAALTGDTAGARSILLRQLSRRGTVIPTPDALYAEARVWLMIGDSARSRSWLDPLLERNAWLTSFPHTTVMVASLVRCLVLSAELAAAGGDRKTAAEWARAMAVLWATADEPLRSQASRLAIMVGS